MNYVLLDTNFILSCIRKKIDFFNEIKYIGLKIIIPSQVIGEIQKIAEFEKIKFREEAKLGLKLIEKNEFKKMDLKTKNVDEGIRKIAKANKEWIIATLDKGIQTKIENKKLIIRGNKELEVYG